jgi:hypothetical protein
LPEVSIALKMRLLILLTSDEEETFQTGANGDNRGKNIAVYRLFPLFRAAGILSCSILFFILVFLFLSFFTDFAPLRLKKRFNGHSGPFLPRTKFYHGQE